MSPRPVPWSRVEVEAAVADYLSMLASELAGQHYSKSEHRRRLSRLLDHRSDGSIERKHQNISAVLIELGYPYIDGYKPLYNYQALLAEVVDARVSSDRELATLVQRSVEEPVVAPATSDILGRLEDPPHVGSFVYQPLGSRRVRRLPVNYLEREARNSSLGRAGEEFVLRFERERLVQLGCDRLAGEIEHTAVHFGDGAGFDIRSFESDGSDRLIEVKTTAYGKETPFFLSRNELAVSQDAQDRYHVYRLYRFREDPRLYSIRGALDQICRLDPVQYAARPK